MEISQEMISGEDFLEKFFCKFLEKRFDKYNWIR